MMTIVNKEERLSIVAVLVVMLLTFVRDVFGVGVNQYLLLIIITVFLAYLKKQQCVNYTFFLLPLLCGIQGLTVTVAIIILLAKTRNANSQYWPFVLIILLLEIFNSAFLGPSDSEFAKKLLLYSSNIFLFFYLLFYNSKTFDYIQPIKFFLIGSTFVMFVILFRSIAMGGIGGLVNDMTRIGLRTVYDEGVEVGTEFQMNPNSLAFYSLFTLTVLLSFNKKLQFSPLLFYTIIVVSSLAGILSFSRTWIMCVALYFILSFLGRRNDKKSIILFAAVVVLAMFYGSFVDSIYDVFLTRFTGENMQTAGQRSTIFSDYNTWMFDNGRFLSGIGILYYYQIANLGHAAHSGIQQIFIGYGFVGLLLFIIVALSYKKLFIPQVRLALLLPFLICLIFDQSIQFLSNPILLFPFVMLAYSLRIDKRLAKM